ncbi:hypothetical protein KDAU_72700 [Dictyobacter aurantiacus]|uniref:Uncharacterized protein n=1 Tax=Dictyobacter aurantiacus TaxID=1936993 RepID=A0A401ZSU9_9CHLR|nr:hypothetical protein KDAU_72700 [Dictyobacter aurantiacus]
MLKQFHDLLVWRLFKDKLSRPLAMLQIYNLPAVIPPSLAINTLLLMSCCHVVLTTQLKV